jgi:Fur family ferric uptake transcriptional regulator
LAIFVAAMHNTDVIDLMMHHGVKPTANRILVAEALHKAGRPMSMMELEEAIGSIDKSGISRTLTLFREQHLVHTIQDGGDGVRYELCHSHSDDHDEDAHVHFYCTRCRKTFCLEDIPIPDIALPAGYDGESVNYMVSGICPACRKHCN